jgi:tetracycline resistance efflux pump
MEPVYVGWLSVLPPIIAIVLALVTKEVIFSVVIGILSGTLIYTFAAGLNPLVAPFSVLFQIMNGWMDVDIMIFCFMLGGLVWLVNASGGAHSYGKWAATKIRSKRSSALMTFLLGIILFIDDYFNCLSVGTIMKPVTDRYKLSRAKLAYIIDSTAAPICIMIPISNWAAAVGGYLAVTGAFDSEFGAFVGAVPFNLYAILSLIMVFIVCAFNFDFGPMAAAERRAEAGDLGIESMDDGEPEADAVKEKSNLFDMMLPIIVFIAVSILFMMYTGGFWGEDPAMAGNFGAALGNCMAAHSLVCGNFAALIVCFIMYLPRKIMTFKEYFANLSKGMSSMVNAGIILVLAWSIGGICRDLLCTPEFMKNFVESTGVSGALLPALVFIVAAFLSFSIGSSWGTFGILIPIVVPIAQSICPNLLIVSLAATLAGSIFGDHCSPISDTTILSSAGAQVKHLEHVSTQMPYALTVAGCSLVGYLVLGFTDGNLIISMIVSIALLVGVVFGLHKMWLSKNPNVKA